MFRTLFQLLIIGFLGVLAYEFFAGDKARTWSYCGDDLKKEKRKMEREVANATRDVGSGAEVTWKENANCISASVKNNQRVSSYLMEKVKERF